MQYDDTIIINLIAGAYVQENQLLQVEFFTN